MADNVELDPGTGGAVVSTEEITTLNGSGSQPAQHVQRMLLAFRTADATAVDAASGGGTEASALRVTIASDSTGVLSVDDNGGSLTVDNAALSVTGGGVEASALRVTIASDSTGVLSVDDNGGSLTVDGTVAVTNAGTFVTQENGAALTALQKIDDPVLVDDAAFTPATSSVMVAGFFADQTSTDSVNEGDIGAARMTLDRKQIVTLSPSADTAGVSVFRSSDIDETEEEVKASAGKLMGYAVYNNHSAEVHLQFWNATAANTTPGTTTPLFTFPIAGGASAHIMFDNGITFDTAICVGATAGFSDATAPGATVSGTIFYV